jgi:hypothetical protein
MCQVNSYKESNSNFPIFTSFKRLGFGNTTPPPDCSGMLQRQIPKRAAKAIEEERATMF